MGKRLILVVAIGVALLVTAAAQDRLIVSGVGASIDGVISQDEYGLSIEMRRATLYLNRTEEVLSVAVQSELDGWVAVGLGSQRMDEASIYIGYVQSGQGVFASQIGRGHGHSDSRVAQPIAFELKEDRSGTVLELSFPAGAFLSAGSNRLALIVACGKRDDLSSYHSMRRGIEIDL